MMFRLQRPLLQTARCRLPSAARRRISTTTGHQAVSHKSIFGATGLVVGTMVGVLAMSSFDKNGKESSSQDVVAPRSQRRTTYANVETTLKALDEIRRELGEDSVSIDADDVEDHGYSEWSTSNTASRPMAVLRPTSTEQVCQIAKICSKHQVPMVPFGAGSSVEGNFASPLSGVCIDLRLMDKIIEFRPDDLDVTVQAGVNWMDLNSEIRSSKLFLPLDPSPTASIGGMIATNCSGTNAIRYGTMKDYVINLTVVLADGSVIKTRQRPRKSSAGYNLNGLFTGSEGTLGIITEATVKLASIPENYSVATAVFPTLKSAADAASAMIRKGVQLAAVELMDNEQMRIVNLSGGAGGRNWAEAPTLFLKFSGSKRAIEESADAVKDIASKFECSSFASASDEKSMDSLWSARKQALWACLAVRPEGTEIWGTDVAVPISKMANMIEECKASASKLGLFTSVLGHVGDGNFHHMIMYNPNKPSDVDAVARFVKNMVHQAVQLEGTVSGEHGIGLGKKDCLVEELGPATVGLMRTLKRSLDPQWLMNPGKVFDEVEARRLDQMA